MAVTTGTDAMLSLRVPLSQGHLNLLTTCPRKFQYLYLDQLGLPQIVEQQSRQLLGTQFHQVMQQWCLGLPVESIVQTNPQLRQWFETFKQSPPAMLPGDRQSEHRRTLIFHDYLLVVVYDLLIQTEGAAQILDWKTYAQPQNPQWIQQNWQTSLYPFVLAETTEYQPEQIQMTYWFAEGSADSAASEPVHSHTFYYNSSWHQQTRQRLATVLEDLTLWLAQFQQGKPLPQVAATSGQCAGNASSCSFIERCQRHQAAESRQIPDLDEIAEVPI